MFNTRNCLKTTTTTTNMMEEEAAAAAAAASTMEETIVLSMIPLGKDKRLEVRSDGVYIHSVSKPEKNIFMSYNKCVYFFFLITLFLNFTLLRCH